MKKRITFDPVVKMGYLYVMNTREKGRIHNTEALLYNTTINVDYDAKGAVVGLEFDGAEAVRLADVANQSPFFKNIDGQYVCQLFNDREKSCCTIGGLKLSFATDDYKELLAITVLDQVTYPIETIQ